MARKIYTGMDEFKKYRDNRKKAEAFRKKVHRKAVRDLKKIFRQKEAARKKRMNAYKREAEKAKTAKSKTAAKNISEPFTFEDFKVLLVLGLFFIVGVSTNFVVALILAVIALIVKVILEMRSEKRENDFILPTLPQSEIDELQRHLSNIDVYKDIANNSSDTYAVQCAMDELLKSIDFIMTYDEDALHSAGMTKAKLPTQRDFIVQHYDDMIAQANERLAKEKNNKTG